MAALQRGGARDDLDELASDDGLSGPVVRERQLLNHLSCRMNVWWDANKACLEVLSVS